MWSIAVVNGIAYGNLLFLLAVGFSMIFGVLKVINLAHGSYYLMGSYVTFSVYAAGFGFVPALLVGAAAGAVLGLLCERFLLYPLQGEYLSQVLVTMGIMLILSDLMQTVWGGTPRLVQVPATLQGSVDLGRFTYPVYRLILIGVGTLIALFAWWSLERTRAGAMVRAAVDDEDTAQAVGISVPRLRLLVFGLGGLLAGLAGGLGSAYVGMRPGLDLEVFLLALVIVVIGGIGSLPGAYAAALGVGLIDSIGKILWPEASIFMLFLPMVLFLLFRPTGLAGRPLPPVAASARGARQRPPWLRELLQPAAVRVARVAKGMPVLACIAIAIAVLAAVPAVAPAYVVGVATLAIIWSIYAMGFNVLLGYAGLPSLGHAAFFGTGAYAVALLGQDAQTGGWLILLAAVAISTLVATLFGLIALRTKLVYFLLSTVALSYVLWGVAFKWRSLTGGDDGLRHSATIGWSEALSPTVDFYYVCAAIFLALAAVMWRVHKSSFRILLNGVRDNDARFAALGYDAGLYRLGAFVLSGALGGLAGGLYAFYARFVSPDLMGIIISAEVLLMVILGGAGTFLGPIVGAFALIALEEIASGWTSYWQTIQGILFIVVVVATRAGIVGAFRSLAVPVRRAAPA